MIKKIKSSSNNIFSKLNKVGKFLEPLLQKFKSDGYQFEEDNTINITYNEERLKQVKKELKNQTTDATNKIEGALNTLVSNNTQYDGIITLYFRQENFSDYTKQLTDVANAFNPQTSDPYALDSAIITVRALYVMPECITEALKVKSSKDITINIDYFEKLYAELQTQELKLLELETISPTAATEMRKQINDIRKNPQFYDEVNQLKSSSGFDRPASNSPSTDNLLKAIDKELIRVKNSPQQAPATASHFKLLPEGLALPANDFKAEETKEKEYSPTMKR